METQKKIFLPDEESTKKLGKEFAQKLTPNSVLLLQGNLGAGKTTFIQGLGEGLGISEPIVSPTFTLINEYLEGKIPLYHIDLYRLNPEQVKHLHLQNYWEGIEVEAGITAIEWSDLLPQLPPHYWQIILELTPDSGRNAFITYI
ncbi:tRNA (adenosine(37)-N6)-threonylcarbamoyltransferase complex ATPase subunit type 1 TsaE [Cyanobacterium aponinum FACHB-4101]|uniref:tRNA (adenosine(37)-N6)-threonylcarbamoyltransferase complex ATPase subunit type 1 TsaE n=1 Tax=Cyanobacterium aponinum TaxID=379064 RepID=UPI0016808460|nr:tRNA (adenosine(37)-N6)-threonylcarbamoyltransferase complex ATPase subunit type 1 TsaE [Cyanobacterium aponinum]MBD2395489.1 tRNA (adenosine(37)-N6)-threonylcarbamoyltransferase complex ATPase subunit type 1 TsaE [Cyanobacterium aponinum FACHB-4101]